MSMKVEEKKFTFSEVHSIFTKLSELLGKATFQNQPLVYEIPKYAQTPNYVVIMKPEIAHKYFGEKYEPVVEFTIFCKENGRNYSRYDVTISVYDLLRAIRERENIATEKFVLIWKKDPIESRTELWIPLEGKLVSIPLKEYMIKPLTKLFETMDVIGRAKIIHDRLRTTVMRRLEKSEIVEKLKDMERKCSDLHRRRAKKTIKPLDDYMIYIDLCRECREKAKNLIAQIPRISIEIDKEYIDEARKLISMFEKIISSS